MKNQSRFGQIAAVSAALTAIMLASGCATTGGTDNADPAKDTLRGTWMTDPTSFDPALAAGQDDYRLARLGFATVLNTDDNGIVAGIASEYTADPQKVTLTIREGLVCADGTPLTASVVGNSLDRLANPETGASLAPMIFGPGEVTVTSDDAANLVTIDVTEPYSELAIGLTVPAAGIICPAGLEDPEGLAAGTVEGAFSGPYTLAEAVPGVNYTWSLRDDYDAWPDYEVPLPGRPAETLEFLPGNAKAIPNMLLTGELDFGNIFYEDAERFEGDDYTLNTPVLGDYFLIFNETESSPFADPALRAAAAQAINREGFLDATNPLGELANTVADPNVQCYNTDESLLQPYDPEAAATALAGVKIRLIGTNIVGVNGAGTVYIAESLRAAGADVELNNADNSAWISTILGPDTDSWDLTLFASINNTGTLVTGLSRAIGPATEDGGRNIMRINKPESTEPYMAALATTDEAEKCAAYQEAQNVVLSNVDLMPLGTNPSAIITVNGVELRSPAGREDYSTVRIVD